jgi:hypothetical protein
MFVTVMFLGGAGFAAAQMTTSSTDVLGAHLNYGRGCTACHSPHSGAYGNGNAKSSNPNSGNTMLWGDDVSSLYGKTITTGGGSYTEVLPTSLSATTPDVNGLLTCLSCHDGNYATGAMMKNKVYEAAFNVRNQQLRADAAWKQRHGHRKLRERAPRRPERQAQLRRVE